MLRITENRTPLLDQQMETIKRADNAQMNVHPDDLYDPSKISLN